MPKSEDKLSALLDVVIEEYISCGDPIGSKFLNTLENIEYAPSTLRKYLNKLEKEGFLYQPYNSSGRVPTIEGLSIYLEKCLSHQEEQQIQEVENARNDLKYLVESLGNIADGVVVGFLRNDEYYYLGMSNLFREDLKEDYEVRRHIIKFVEDRKILKSLDTKILKRNKIYYTFLEDDDTVISCLYAKFQVNEYDGVLSIIGPSRVDYKHNAKILMKILSSMK